MADSANTTATPAAPRATGLVIAFPGPGLEPRSPAHGWQNWRFSSLPSNCTPISHNYTNRDLDAAEVLILAIMATVSRKKGFRRFVDEVLQTLASSERGNERERMKAFDALFEHGKLFPDEPA